MRFSLSLLAVVAASQAARADSNPAALEFFEKKVRPTLVSRCYACHSAETKPAGGLRVDDRNGLLTGGNNGPAVVVGNPEKSLLLKRVTQHDDKKRMPRDSEALPAAAIADLTTWIKDGAVWPAVSVPASFGRSRARYEAMKKEHWAWQPLTDPKPPAVRNAAWPKDDIDRFILAKLETQGLTPSADADKVALLRRVTFDLTGLPPTGEQIDAFVKDTSADAFAKVVDGLLASPRFGERWGRHWLDVARYAESTGPSRNIPYPHAWRYRDYVIDRVNEDMPFDRFILEQLAGDLLPAASDAERDRQCIATGFLALGVKDVNQRFKVRFLMDNVDEQIDVVGRAVLGLTVSCARCHDHKFDPIPQSDYYALAGIFTSTDNCAGVGNRMGGAGLAYYEPSLLLTLSTSAPPASSEKVAKLTAEVAEAQKAWDAIRGTPEGLKPGPNGQPTQRPVRLKYERLRGELLALTDPAARGHAAHGVRDGKVIGDTELRVRGEAEKLGPVVPRGFLNVFSVPDASPVNIKQSGRLELAQWLTSRKNPLTPRVAVNRVWQHLFDRGIVSTVDNFGVTGDKPSHSELLDHLANRFIREGWSVKKLVRAIVLTHAYQLGSEASAAARTADPANRLVWRHTPRRLETEEIRDAMLAAAGTLNLNRPAASPAKDLRMVEMRDDGAEAANLHNHADRSLHRSVYLPVLRGVTPRSLEAFDPVEQTLVTGRRDATTVPGQALYLLNSPFVQQQSVALAARLGKDASDKGRIETAYRLTLGRLPTDKESERALAFLAEYESVYRDRPAATPKPEAKPSAAPVDPDAPVEPSVVEVKSPRDAKSAAWVAFAQALLGSAEFRYLP
jgi:cytochrome c553